MISAACETLASVRLRLALERRPAGAAPGLDAAPPSDYERAQVQPLPHVQVAPQLQPGRRVWSFFLDI
jgi:hypothetical protein